MIDQTVKNHQFSNEKSIDNQNVGKEKIIKNKKLIGAFLGTIVEYYDYSLYGLSSGILVTHLLPAGSKLSQLINVFLIYMFGYFGKPLGGLFFSYIGDVYGRKTALRITMLGIALPTFVIAMLPSYQTAGMFTAYMLMFCRFFQGFFVAGEYDGAAIYVIEHFGLKRGYIASAVTRATGVIGMLIALLSINFFNSSLFDSINWSWRIPFFLSLPFALFTLYYRSFLQETPEFISSKNKVKNLPADIENISYYKQKNSKIRSILSIFTFMRKYHLDLMLTILLAGGFGVTYQVSIMFMKQYLVFIIPGAKSLVSNFFVFVVILFGFSMVLSGFLADKFGHMKIIYLSSAFASLSIFLMIFAVYIANINFMLFSASLMAFFVAPFNGLAHGFMAHLFPANVRYRGVNIGHTVGSMFMSSTTGYVCFSLIKQFKSNLIPLFYALVFVIVATITMHYINNRSEKNNAKK